jgi:hypothetical protein
LCGFLPLLLGVGGRKKQMQILGKVGGHGAI